jgi:hypothetical protein
MDLDVDLAKLFTLGLLAALSAIAANRAVAVYHDGLRTSIPELLSGEQTRPQLARYAYGISLAFVVAYALPYTVVTGILVIHIICLGADVIGVGLRQLPVAAAAGFGYGVVCAALADALAAGIADLPRVPGDMQLLWLPLIYAMPFLPALAAAYQFGTRVGVIASVATAGIWLVVNLAHDDELLAGPLPGGAVAFGLVGVAVLAMAWRVPTESEPDLAFFSDKITRIRRNWWYLLPVAAVISISASQGWLAGDPLQLALLAGDEKGLAALAGVFAVVGLFPVQGMTGLVSGVWNADGYPDWFLAAGYLTTSPWIAGVAGAGLMTVELATLRGAAFVLTRKPGVPSLGHAARDAMDVMGATSILAGAVLAAMATAGPLGAVAVVAAHGVNEAKGQRIMPIALPVFAYIAVAIAAAIVRS